MPERRFRPQFTVRADRLYLEMMMMRQQTSELTETKRRTIANSPAASRLWRDGRKDRLVGVKESIGGCAQTAKDLDIGREHNKRIRALAVDGGARNAGECEPIPTATSRFGDKLVSPTFPVAVRRCCLKRQGKTWLPKQDGRPALGPGICGG